MVPFVCEKIGLRAVGNETSNFKLFILSPNHLFFIRITEHRVERGWVERHYSQMKLQS